MTTRLEKALRELQPEEIEKVSDFAESLVRGHRLPSSTSPRFSWAGALADLKDQYTSVELQHKANEWRSHD